MDTQTQTKPQLSPYQEGVKKALKQAGEAHTAEALQQGVPAQHIEQQSGLSPDQLLKSLLESSSQGNSMNDTMNQVSTLANQKFPVAPDGSLFGDKVGILPALLQMTQGKGFNPMAQKTQPLGFEKAIQLTNLNQSMQAQALQRPKTAIDILKGLTDIQQSQPEFRQKELRAEEQIKSDVAAETESKKTLAKEQLETEKTFNQVLNLNDNLISTIKGAYEQQGGSGPIAGAFGNVKSALGMPNTGNIKAIKAVKRDTAISYAKQLAGSARGVTTLFKSVLDSLPDNSFSSEQAGTTIAELSLTAYALKKGINDLKLSQDQINSMSSSQLEVLTRKERNGMSQEEQDKIYSAIQDRFSKIAPRKSINLEGKISSNPQTKGILHIDANGNKAYQMPDGSWKEVK